MVVFPVISKTLPVAVEKSVVVAATKFAQGACRWTQYFLFHIEN